MTKWTRRGFIAATGATLTACSTVGINQSRDEIEFNVSSAKSELFRTIPGTQQLADQAAGILIIPEVTSAGLFLGGAYGEGALLIGDAAVDHFSFTAASFGLQFGVQRYSHALFLMTQEALAGFRNADGWQLGIDAEYVFPDQAASFGVNTSTINLPVYAVVYGQQGLIVGATLEGAKYSRLIR